MSFICEKSSGEDLIDQHMLVGLQNSKEKVPMRPRHS